MGVFVGWLLWVVIWYGVNYKYVYYIVVYC